MERFSKLLGIGIISGLILGGVLGIVQQFTNKKVYLLLMNVDYIPIVKGWNVGPVLGFIFHLIVSVALVFVLYYVLKKLKLHQKIAIYILANTFGGALLFSLTALSERTPAITDATAFIFWVIGHAIYGASVGGMVYFMLKNRSNHNE